MVDEINYLDVLAENIKRLRGRITQKGLAKKAGIGKSTVNAIEQGRAISLEKLIKIAKALKVHPSDLFISEKDRKEISYKHKLLIDRFTESLEKKE